MLKGILSESLAKNKVGLEAAKRRVQRAGLQAEKQQARQVRCLRFVRGAFAAGGATPLLQLGQALRASAVTTHSCCQSTFVLYFQVYWIVLHLASRHRLQARTTPSASLSNLRSCSQCQATLSQAPLFCRPFSRWRVSRLVSNALLALNRHARQQASFARLLWPAVAV
jgi:hypothetical protein